MTEAEKREIEHKFEAYGYVCWTPEPLEENHKKFMELLDYAIEHKKSSGWVIRESIDRGIQEYDFT